MLLIKVEGERVGIQAILESTESPTDEAQLSGVEKDDRDE